MTGQQKQFASKKKKEEKVKKSRCYTKSRMGAAMRAYPSFGMTMTQARTFRVTQPKFNLSHPKYQEVIGSSINSFPVLLPPAL